MAPELAAGAAPGPRADVFALGLTLLQLLAASEAAGLATHAAATLGAAGPAGVERLVDPCAGAWPPAQAADFARLALRQDYYWLCPPSVLDKIAFHGGVRSCLSTGLSLCASNLARCPGERHAGRH